MMSENQCTEQPESRTSFVNVQAVTSKDVIAEANRKVHELLRGAVHQIPLDFVRNRLPVSGPTGETRLILDDAGRLVGAVINYPGLLTVTIHLHTTDPQRIEQLVKWDREPEQQMRLVESELALANQKAGQPVPCSLGST